MKVILLNDVEKFICSLEKQTSVKIFRTLKLLEKFDIGLGMPHSKRIKTNLFELRVLGKNQVRLFYTFLSPNIIVLCGFKKKSQKIPTQQLAKAIRKLRELDTI